MKHLTTLLILTLLPLMTFSQSVVVLRSLEISPNSHALVQYNNIFGNWENREVDDSFPYVVIQMNLEGDANAISQAKLNLSLDLGTLYQVTATDKNQQNQILFLVPKGARNIYLLCGDGCTKQLLFSGALIENKVYTCTAQYSANQQSSASNDEMADMRKQLEEMKQLLLNQQKHNSQSDQNVTQNMTPEELYYKGKNYYDAEDYTTAIEYFRKAAAEGHADAQCSLGICYERGKGTEQSFTKAVEWYRKAAEQGNVEAQFFMGIYYQYGQSVEQSYTKAVEWYLKAAAQGHAQAQIYLGWCYEMGYGIEQSYTMAAEWYRKAAAQGEQYVKNNLKKLYKEGKISSPSY